MTDLEKLMLLLPIMFMLHEYEEVVMFKQWIFQNRGNLKRHFPKVEAFITERGLFDYSTSTFAVGTAHEFILLSCFFLCRMARCISMVVCCIDGTFYPFVYTSCTMDYIP